MLMIILLTFNLIRNFICGSRLTWPLNLNLTVKILKIGERSFLLTLMLAELDFLFNLIIQKNSRAIDKQIIGLLLIGNNHLRF